jgi:hypothetical protein
MAFAGGPTIVLGEVHMIDLRDVGSDDPDRILLFDIGVERVVQEAAIGFVHLSDNVRGIGECIEHVALEAVRWLDRKLNVVSRRMGGVFVHAHSVGAFGFRWRVAGEDAEGLVERPAKRLTARGRQTVDCPFEMIESGGADRRICADAIALDVRNDCDGRRPEATVADRSTDCAEVFRRSFKNRKLDPVKTRPLDAREQGKVLLGDMRRP